MVFSLRYRFGIAAPRLGAVAGAVFIAALLLTPHASAAYEQVGIFAGGLEPPAEKGVFPEEVQLGATGGMAVNYTGAGGAAAGTVYVATRPGGQARVAVFTPKPDGGLEFSGAWEVNEAEPPEHCGPQAPLPPCSPQPGGQAGEVDVDVDQSTGNVYVFSAVNAGKLTITEYSPDGSKVIARFGKMAESGKTTAETPAEVHGSAFPRGTLAVNNSGEVYLFDVNSEDKFYHRLMVFKPQTPGDYEHYVYAGQENDIGAGFIFVTPYETQVVADAAGGVYSADDESVQKYDPAKPTKAVCSFKFVKAGITGMTVNPANGEVFFYSFKNEKGFTHKVIHQLSPCNEATGKFTETAKFEVAPGRDDLYALTFDPVHKFSSARPPGVLYAGAPGPVSNSSGDGETGASSLGYFFALGPGAPKLKLAVTKSGTGAGLITSVPAFGISCGATCSAEFEEGKEVELKQQALIDSKFVKWGGACSGTGICKVTMSAAKEVSAEFAAKPKFKLTVTTLGAGKVTSSPAGIECGGICTAEFAEDRIIELIPNAESGFEFQQWSGACSGSGICKVTITEAKEVTAKFGPPKPRFKLTVTTLGAGAVSSTPAGIFCGSTCSAEFKEGTEVELSPAAEAGSEFKEWSGACSGSGICKVTITEAKEVTAEFGAAKPKFKLTVTKPGTGAGKVTSSPPGISCDPTCSAEYTEGTEVELKQEASPGSEFKEWGGACTGSATCKVTVTEARSVTAAFEAKPTPEYTLTVTVTGEGEVSAGSGTISGCTSTGGPNCKGTYKEGAKVTLTETPGAGQQFNGWGTPQCDESTATTCLIEVKGDEGVAASFGPPKPKFKLTISKPGTGSGKVTSTPSGISCDPTCSFEYEEGSEVELKQEASPGSEFKEWSGACSGSGACKVTMSEAKSVSALFEAKPTPEFTLTVVVSGEGKVSASAGTIAGCTSSGGPACKGSYLEGTKVTLTQSANPGSEFSEWTGACSGSGACEVTMSAAKEVSAKFDLIPTPKFKLSVTTSGTGTGKVTSTPAGISCDPTCSDEYTEGTEVELKQEASPGSEFKEWSGACSGSGTCKVTMSAAKTVGAKFDLIPKAKFKLKVKTTGSGSGKVSGPGIDCGTECEAEYEEGTKVTLAQSASPGSEFKEWTGACTGTTTCEVTMSAAKEVSAKFDLVPKFKLSVSKPGTGTGKVTSTPAGISCDPTCSAEYESGKEVELKASPAAGSEFVKWGGACAGTGSCKVTMSEAKSVSAEFKLLPKLKFKLSVTKSGTGTGTVTSTPSGISCDPTCGFEYEEGKAVELKAAASPGSEFTEWTGACTGSGSCKVTMSAAKSVGARFDLIPTFKLSVSVSGTGTGTVTSTPAGIDCGTTCSAEYEAGTAVELTPTPDEGSEFKEWQGACKGTGTCQLTMSAAKSVTAVFKATPTYRLLIQKSGTGSGTVKSAPPIAAIDCGTECEAKLPAGTEVQLIATPEPGSEFFQWSGACAGTGTCEVTMGGAKTVHATFKEIPKLTLSVTKTGQGTVTSSPAGINCGTECEHEYPAATAITLTATPARGYRLKGWGGCDSASGATCTLTLGSTRSVGATFVLAKCKRGFHKKKIKGKPRCVRTKRHASHRRGARNSLALPAFWP